MALKEILVAVESAPASVNRIEAAAALARARDAHVIGLHVTAGLLLPAYVEAELPGTVREMHERARAERAVAAKAAFDQVMARHGLTEKSEWRAVDGDPTAVTAAQGRYADLVVVGQRDPKADPDVERVDAEALLFDCGRPILVVPHTGHVKTVGERVVVAWNASREAARAVGDAMDILSEAHKVVVMAVNPKRAGLTGLGDAPGADIAHHLSRHGCHVEAAQVSTDQLDPADALLNVVSDEAADMVVMGAYGRSRLREMVLGGVTRFMLRHATVPVLMSH